MQEEERKTEFIRVAILENPFEAQLLEQVLVDENIPHMILSYHDTAYDGLFQFQKGWGEVRGPEARKDEILSFIEDIRTPVDSEYSGNNQDDEEGI